MSDREFDNINGIKVCDQTARNKIPTKTSQLENDSDYATITQVNQAIDNAQIGGGGETVDLSGYVTKERGNANQITFADGQTFQAKLDAGTLKGAKGDKGDKGDTGEQGPQGIQGPQGPKGDAGSGGGSSINDTTASATTTYSSNKIESIKENLNSQITTINNNIQNIGNPTDEQVKNVINEAIANGDIVAGGLTSTAQTLLVNILRSAVFTSDQSANITLLQSELAKGNSGGSSGGGSETTQYTITNTLNNATTSNSAVLVDANSSYSAIIRENDGYTLETITVTMGGTDITSSAVSGTTITINSVTGNVVITVTTTESGSSSGGGGSTELIQDGLVALFDYRTATVESPYNQPGWGNVAKATIPSCQDYYLFNVTGTYAVDPAYGITSNWGIRGIRQTSSPTTSITLNGLSNTVIGLIYGKCICNIYGMVTTTNMSNEIMFTPKYINSSGSMVSLASVKLSANNYKDKPGYSLYALTESDTELKLYIDGQLKHTVNSSECTDFVKWYTNEGCAYPYFNSNDAYSVAFAVYNRPLSAVEIVEATEYFKAMEVSN